MEIDDFRKHVGREKAPAAKWPPEVKALWWDAKRDWEKAHELSQVGGESPHCDWVHAYLHRKEGDLGNARYWYQRAGKTMPGEESLEQEWVTLVAVMLP